MAERKSAKGCWVIMTPDPIVENSEIRALRKAVDLGARVQFVEWGNPISGGATHEDGQTTSSEAAASEPDIGY